jgi:hypothetical protein
LRGGGGGGGSKPWSSSIPDFSITTCARSSAGAARGTFARGDTAGVGTATARGGGGVESSDGSPAFSGGSVGLFSGFGVSFSFLVAFAFEAFLPFDDAFFFCDFFFAPFGFGVGLGDFLDFFGATVDSGVSVRFGFGVSSSSPDAFVLLLCGDSFGVTEASVSLLDSSVASFAFGIGLGDSSGVRETLRFFFDLLVAAFALATGFGDFFGVGDEEVLVSCWLFPDSSADLSSSLLTCPRRRLPAIALSATAVASQRRKRDTATERNRARDAINPQASRGESLRNLQGRRSELF